MVDRAVFRPLNSLLFLMFSGLRRSLSAGWLQGAGEAHAAKWSKPRASAGKGRSAPLAARRKMDAGAAASARVTRPARVTGVCAAAAAASTAMLVPGYFLPRAAGLNQSLMGIMTVGAPPLGALAMSAMPLGWALAIDVATALLGIAPLLFFTIPQPRAARGGGWRSLWREWREGVQAVWRHAALRQLYALIGAAVMCVMPLFTLVPLLVKTHFAGGANQVALMESLSGIGMIAGGAFVAAFAPQRRMRWFLWGFALSGLTMALTALAPADQFGLGAAFWLLSGLTFAVGNAPFMAMLQSAVPNHLQGRVLSLLNTLIGLAGPVGLALAAPLGEALGSRWLFVLLGACGGLVMLLGFASRALRRMEQGESGGSAGS